MPSTSTRSWSRSTPTLVSPARLWESWTPSSTISSSVLPAKLPVLPTTTSVPPSPAGKSRPPSVLSCPESWPSTPSLREPRLSPSTPAPSKQFPTALLPQRPFSRPPKASKKRSILHDLLGSLFFCIHLSVDTACCISVWTKTSLSTHGPKLNQYALYVIAHV